MTRHCLTCQGVIAVAPDPSSPIRWCQCRGPRDGKDAEIVRLRALVREAFHEGFKAAYCTALTDEEAVVEFDRSDAKKALGQ